MKVNRTDDTIEFYLEGAIGEGASVFQHDIRGVKQILMDMEKVTYINSVGVKAWIQWTGRIPPDCQFSLRRLPLVMINQASTVVGFMPPQARIESFFAPFVCPKCNTETTVLLSKGKEYDYAEGGSEKKINIPEVPCPKCNTIMESDFTPAKTFTFLDLPNKGAV